MNWPTGTILVGERVCQVSPPLALDIARTLDEPLTFYTSRLVVFA